MIGTEIGPICALQVAMEGYQVTTMNEAASQGDIFVTATGYIDANTIDHIRHMKDRAIVCNIGHFDSEIRSTRSGTSLEGGQAAGRRGRLSRWQAADGAGQGRLVNLGCATGHPSFVMSASFTNQVLAQIELFTNHGKYENKVYVLARLLHEKVTASTSTSSALS